MPSSAELEPGLAAVAAALLDVPRATLTRARGGANNRVYRVDTPRGAFALKQYPQTAGDPRDRLGAETAAAAFLERHGVAAAPRLVAADRARGLAVYGWIEGEAVTTAGDADIAAAVAFAAALHRLRGAEDAAALPPASEACLSGAELVAQVERRLERLRGAAPAFPALAALLDGGAAPALDRAAARARAAWAAAGLEFAAGLAPERRTLSPSDFGFHNARRRPDGSLAFLDFEYFGWDDPVKLAADFVLHPGMALTPAQARDFLAGVGAVYGDDPSYAVRLAALFPLYGLRWCMILLNEFLPERWARRVQAGAAADRDAVLAAQLAKAEAMLARVRTGLKEGMPVP